MTSNRTKTSYPAGTTLGTRYGLMEVQADGSLKPYDPPVPEELRVLLLQVYTPEGVEVWWRGHHRLLGTRPQAIWVTRRDDVLALVDQLLSGGFV
jgi:hypothetical protein